MRRRVRWESIWDGSKWVTNQTVRYVYDGMLVIQERDANNLPTVTYTRGLDLSGSFEGAGGIGGLLARVDHGLLAIGDSRASAYYHADGNGNVTMLISMQQLAVAKYLYDPFGNTLSLSGPLAEANTYRFSSKELHTASGLVYYGYRFYDPNLQRWPNRDPIEELGGKNLYTFGANDSVDFVDSDGLQLFGAPAHPPQIPPPPAFPSKPFEYPPAGTGGTSGGNLPPAFPTINNPPCSEEGALRETRGTYDGGFCPCTNMPRRCFDYERCEFVGTAGTRGTTGRLGWVPHTSCTKCPEGNYPPK
jgi:RHS repeat-associated protein